MHKTCYGCNYEGCGSYEYPCMDCNYIDGKRNWIPKPEDGEEDWEVLD